MEGSRNDTERSCGDIQASNSFVDSVLLKSPQSCTHTHTCNPPGPGATHTHTCYHAHTHVIPSEQDRSPVSTSHRPAGNREAVRKYREKKKAHAAYLEEEVKKLRRTNKLLMGKLQRQSVLEAEAARLRGILVNLRGKIDCELGDCHRPYSWVNDVRGGECGPRLAGGADDVACGLGGLVGSYDGISECGKGMANWGGTCGPVNVECETDEKFVESAEKCLQDSLAV
ncbi:Basic-leucine zipper (bZIP) transcription factor family protein [Striga hermonthica]|uniref:Basic-leucine zipper (BZIP) transcription factor family protein n=1 Tax=Striga hermonthica TaxID=68872 RepID=A0A9N7MR67_STRHE|nr:Basic-leucine zipper (bZIP) transcription factor family protein [Striga hermonthica]